MPSYSTGSDSFLVDCLSLSLLDRIKTICLLGRSKIIKIMKTHKMIFTYNLWCKTLDKEANNLD